MGFDCSKKPEKDSMGFSRVSIKQNLSVKNKLKNRRTEWSSFKETDIKGVLLVSWEIQAGNGKTVGHKSAQFIEKYGLWLTQQGTPSHLGWLLSLSYYFAEKINDINSEA